MGGKRMYFLDFILFLGVIVTIISIIFFRIFSKENKYTTIFYFLPIVLSIMHFIIGRFNYLVVPVYMTSIVVLLAYMGRKRKIIYIMFCIVSIILSLLPLGISEEFDLKNYASMSYSEAFKNLNAELKENYPFTDWKRIDFDEKYNEYIERFKNADKSKDEEEYYLALKDYLISFNDGHITTINPLQLPPLGIDDKFVSSLSQKYTGAGYGFSLIKLDNGNVVVSMIDENSEAYKSGIRRGTIIAKWNDKPIEQAANEVSKTWSIARSADKENMEQNNYMMLTKTKEGESVRITFIDELNKEKTVALKAEKGNYNIGTKDRDLFFHKENNSKEFEYKLLNNKHGYIYLKTMQPQDQKQVLEQFKKALNEFKENKAEDLIIDVRNNGGGDDKFGAKIAGLFSKNRSFYLQENLYNPENKVFEKQLDLFVEPNYIGFDQKIVVLANSKSVSATEGFVYNLKKLDNVISAGITGTNGSFGTISDGQILMPENYIINYPKIACLDENGKIMIDSDYTGIGGVKPDLKIPLDMKPIKEIYEKGNDYEMDYVINYLESKLDRP